MSQARPEPTDRPDPSISLHEDRDALCAAVAEALVAVLQETVTRDGVAHAALTGGGAGIGVLEALSTAVNDGAASGLDLSAVHLWWGDERLLPERDAERNAQQAADALIDELVAEHGLPAENVHPMPSSEEAATGAVGAEQYAEQLARFASAEQGSDLAMPDLAVTLLGLGPDGHVASLFPQRPSLQVTGDTTVGEEDSPKPPPARVSLTMTALRSSRRIWLVVAGSDKAEAVRLAFQDGVTSQEIPARAARGRLETLWHVDQAAAAELPG